MLGNQDPHLIISAQDTFVEQLVVECAKADAIPNIISPTIGPPANMSCL
jgi:hypothetical protein